MSDTGRPKAGIAAMDVTREKIDGGVLLRVGGTVDIETSPVLRNDLQQLLKEGARTIVVSLEGADRVDTSGLATLVECAGRLSAAGGRLLAVGLRAKATDTHSLARIEGTLAMFDAEAEALANLK